MKKAAFTENWTCNGTSVIVPHDAMIHETRDENTKNGGATGFYPGGVYTYFKTFPVPMRKNSLFRQSGRRNIWR